MSLSRRGMLHIREDPWSALGFLRADAGPARAPQRVGRPVRRLTGHTAGVKAALLMPDARHVMSASPDDKTLRVWNLETGEQEHVVRGHGSGTSSQLPS